MKLGLLLTFSFSFWTDVAFRACLCHAFLGRAFLFLSSVDTIIAGGKTLRDSGVHICTYLYRLTFSCLRMQCNMKLLSNLCHTSTLHRSCVNFERNDL